MRTVILVQLVLCVIAIFVPIFVLLLAPVYFTAPMIWSPMVGAFALLCIFLHLYAEGL